jgi:hypothetical protein
MQEQGQNVLKAGWKVPLPRVLVPREAQASRYSEGERVLLLHGVLKAHPLVPSEGLTAESTRELSPTISSTSVRVCASS